MTARIAFLFLVLVCEIVRGTPLDAGTNELVLSVTTNHYIPCSLPGRVDIVFADAVTMFQQPDVLDLIQSEYERELPAGEKPEFAIKPCGTNTW